MPKLKGKTQVTVHIDNEDYEDMKVVTGRRGQPMAEFIRRAVEAELARDADLQMTD